MVKTKDKNFAAIGKRIKEVRMKNGITQEALAEKVGLGSAQQISDIERGFCGLSVPKLMAFCRGLAVDADYLLFGTATRDTNNSLNQYLSNMTPEQSRCAEELVSAYAKSCRNE